MPAKGLGWRPSPPDERDYQYAVASRMSLPLVPMWKYHWNTIGIYPDQGYTSRCTGFSAARAYYNGPVTHGRPGSATFDRMATGFYQTAQRLDGDPDVYPNFDQGATMRSLARALRERAVITEYNWAWDVDTALQALTVQCVIFGMPWFASFDRALPGRQMHLDVNSELRGGHAIEASGFNMTRRLIRLDQSWGDGHRWLSFDDLDTLFKMGDTECIVLRDERA